jgi:histidinol dehydrogenase
MTSIATRIHPTILRGPEARANLTRSFGDNVVPESVLERNQKLYGERLTPQQVVDRILRDVRLEGDVAVERYSKLLDGLPAFGMEVPHERLVQARDSLEPALLTAIRTSISRLRAFHEAQPTHGFLEHSAQGALGQLVRPIDRVGLYAPNGASPLASSVIHTVIPAKVAGVPEIILCSPPGRDGLLDATTLAAALECGVDRVFALGGAVAIGAMAYGTATVPRVDKIGGPGNLYTVLAMRAVFGQTGIVSLPGPTETMVVCDSSANPRFVAADLLAQAEHVQAEPVLVSTSLDLIDAVLEQIETQTAALPEPNQTWAKESWASRGKIVLAESLEEALELANHYAPEHLCLLLEQPWEALGKVRNAGGVFIGEDSMEALGDYNAGPSHVMPTGGTARFSSPVNVRDFQKIISVVGLNRNTLEQIAPDAARLARAEGLEAHARAIESRLE